MTQALTNAVYFPAFPPTCPFSSYLHKLNFHSPSLQPQQEFEVSLVLAVALTAHQARLLTTDLDCRSFTRSKRRKGHLRTPLLTDANRIDASQTSTERKPTPVVGKLEVVIGNWEMANQAAQVREKPAS